MNAQFHTPSFGDEVFDLTDVDPIPSIDLTAVNRFNSVGSNEDLRHSKVETAEPVKPVSAYALFFRDTVSAIKAQNPNTSFEDISKIVHSMWQVLDPAHKNVYNKKNELAKKEYIKKMAEYHMQMRQVQDDSSNYNQVNTIQHPNISPKSSQIASKPAVFTISRSTSESSPMAHDQQAVLPQSNILFCNNVGAQTTPDATNQKPQNVQLVSDAGSVQVCIRDNCNKRAIINPDWEDEYCSNECVVIHCRNVFNQWVKSNLEAQV